MKSSIFLKGFLSGFIDVYSGWTLDPMIWKCLTWYNNMYCISIMSACSDLTEKWLWDGDMDIWSKLWHWLFKCTLITSMRSLSLPQPQHHLLTVLLCAHSTVTVVFLKTDIYLPLSLPSFDACLRFCIAPATSLKTSGPDCSVHLSYSHKLILLTKLKLSLMSSNDQESEDHI